MRDIFEEIYASIRRNLLRTCLTGFSVAWGIFMLIVLLGAGQGLQHAFLMGGAGLATNTIQVGGGYTSKPYDGLREGRLITLDGLDVELTGSDLFKDHIDQVAPSLSVGATINYGKNRASGSMQGDYPERIVMEKMDMLYGRFLNPYDIKDMRKVVVIPENMAEDLAGSKEGIPSLLGQNVKIGPARYKVVGIIKSDKMSDGNTFYAPFSTVKLIYAKGKNIDDITFTFHGLDTEEENEAFEKEYRSVVNLRHRADPSDERALWTWNRFTQNLQMQKGAGILNTALWVIGLFTLLGGIVGVSNIMLITVKERTHEIGVRKAIGAKPWNITKLIIAESVTITAFFGYVGMILGMVVCEILDKTLGQSSVNILDNEISMLVDPTVNVDIALEATLVLIIAGTIAGLFPAMKAAKVRPIEALRAG